MKRTGAALLLTMAVLAVGCAVGETQPATHVTDVGATLTGKVRNSEDVLTRYRFEYGPTEAYGSATPWRETEIGSGATRVAETVGGLPHAALRHFRLCASDANGRGVCGADRTLTTTDGKDSVVGEGLLVEGEPPATGDFSASVDARSGPSGAAPSGRAVRSPGALSPHIPDGGRVTCLKVFGDRATVGFATEPTGTNPNPTDGGMIFIKDNGPTGDYLNHRWEATPPTTCPTATDDFFIAAPAGSDPPFAALVSGDFQVHDHLDSAPSAR